MRLFIASPVILHNYNAIKEDFKDIVEGRWTEVKKLHLTWVFLSGHPTLTDTKEMMSSLTTLESKIEISDMGHFGEPPRILFAKAEQEVLYDKSVEFKSAGFDLHHFKPHITLCRIDKILDKKAYEEKMKVYAGKALGTILPEIILYESRHTSKGYKYQNLYKVTDT